MSEITYDYRNCLASAIGPEHGLTAEELSQFVPKAVRALKKIRREQKKAAHAFLLLPYAKQQLQEIQKFANSRKGSFRDLVVLGIGGSALGMSALHAALNSPFHNLSPEAGKPRVFVLDNIDPELFAAFLDRVDLDSSVFNVISKSGSTAETMAQFLIIREKLKARFGEQHKEKIILTTDPENGPLRQIAREEGYASFPVPIPVGGRFSVLSAVGLLPAALSGIDIQELIAGALEMDIRCKSENFDENPALQYAAVHYLLHSKRKKNLFVNFCYSERLRLLSDWWKQLVGESLGKRLNDKGKEVFLGPTPISAVGVTDQHSQVQLYMEGPFDKFFTLIHPAKFSRDLTIPNDFPGIEAASSLASHSLGKLFDAECAGTEVALTQAKRPNEKITFSEISPRSVGSYILMMELAVALLGKFYRVNPYDQPGVEAGKIAARKFLSGS